MKQNGILSNIQSSEALDIEEVGDDHLFSGIETPLRKDAFAMEDELKMELI
jgi:GTP cyclohydrolase I